jgi:hypothetical protein
LVVEAYVEVLVENCIVDIDAEDCDEVVPESFPSVFIYDGCLHLKFGYKLFSLERRLFNSSNDQLKAVFFLKNSLESRFARSISLVSIDLVKQCDNKA